MPDQKQPCPRDAAFLRLWGEMMQDPQLDLYSKISLVSLDVDMIQGVDRAYADWMTDKRDMIRKFLAIYEREYFFNLVREVADQTGADPAQIINLETRTSEQKQAMVEAAARRDIARIDNYFSSNYVQAIHALGEVDSLFYEPADPDVIGEKELFALYYFTMRPDIHPSGTGQFTDADKESLIAQYKRFEAFIDNRFDGVECISADELVAALEAFVSIENPTNAQEIIERLKTVSPDKYVMPNNKLANRMTSGFSKLDLSVSHRGAKKPISVICDLMYEGDNVHLSGRQPFTEYDRNVYNAVSSLYVYGDPSHVVTPATVYRAMTGLTDNEKPSAGQLAAVTRSLDKMRFIRVRINCTAELQARRITLNSKQINGGEIDTYLLAAEAIKVQAGRQTVKGYHIIKTPILYEYAAAVNQVLTVSTSTLDVKEIDSSGRITTRSLPNTEARILLKGYLIRRIEGMKGKNGLKNPVIALYDYKKDGETNQGLYSIAGKADAARKEMQRIREDVEKMLAYWKATGYIIDYETQTKGKKITGYKITV